MIVSLLALAGVLGIALTAVPGARAGTCGQSNPYVNTDWVVSSPQTCSGIMFYLDGNLNINAGGSLTMVDGGITFVQDATHVHAWSIAAGTTMTLDNATVTTSTNTLNPYVKLAVAVSGNLKLQRNSMLKFPGNLALNSGSTLNMTDSTITGFTSADLNGLGDLVWMDDNDDSAVITMTGSTANLYGSTIERLYENTQAGQSAKNFTLASGSVIHAYDSYIGVDFSNDWRVHNVMNLDGTSQTFFYNVTIDQAQSDATPRYQQLPAFVPASGGLVNILRWMDGKATDPYGTPLVSASIWSHVGSQTAQYPDNGNAVTPSSQTLWYLGRTAANFNVTDANGKARIPLWTDQITAASLPNANSFGSYMATGKYQTTYVGNASASFATYPSITASDNNLPVVVALPVPGLTPDLTIAAVTISGGNGVSDYQPLNRPFTINATVHNTGQNPVTNAVVLFFSINVDLNSDGIMDSSVAAYQGAGYVIGNVTIPSAPANGNAFATAVLTVPGSFETGVTLSVVANPPTGNPAGPSAIPETNLTNNIAKHVVSLITWPDLAIVDLSDVHFPVTPVANNNVPVDVTVHNLGTGPATAANLVILEGGNPVSNQAAFSLSAGQVANLEVLWQPTSVGNHTLTVTTSAAGSSMRNTDYNITNNAIVVVQDVRSQPDLALIAADYSAITPLNVSQNRQFSFVVRVHNLGETPVENTSVAVYLNGNLSVEYGRTDGVALTTEANVTVIVSGIPLPGNQQLTIVVNPDHTLIEGGLGLANDAINLPMTVNPPRGSVLVYNPVAGTNYGPSDQVFVQGVVRDTDLNPIPSLTVTIQVRRSDGTVLQSVDATTDASGLFQATVTLNNLPDGTYDIHVLSAQGNITATSNSIVVKANVPFFSQPVPLIGIPWWLFLIILAAVAAIVIGVTVYFKVYGLGKMVECGECGAFIPEDATVCPKCGVEFEKDMAKCSNCQAWIPVDVKQCPECGVEFATGEVEMADYQEKMRLQYDEVVQKFKEDASRQLGRALSDKEFQEWWRKQPTFLTFEDWLREEEEMRKMGSKPCPVCGTLNSVTATVCHKCGSLMKQDQRPPSGGAGSGGMAPAVRQRAAAPQAPPSDQGQAGGSQAAGAQSGAPRPVIRRPVTPAPVVQKRVIKRPATEGEQAGTQDQGTDQTSGDQNQGDEL
jgi:ribosomal protein L40E